MTVERWIAKCRMRSVSVRAVLDKLSACRDAGIDVDRIPLSLTLSDILRFSVQKIRTMAGQ